MPGDDAVLAHQRHYIRDRRQRDQVEIAPGLLPQGATQLPGDRRPAQGLEWVLADLGMEDQAVRQLRSRLMVVGDDEAVLDSLRMLLESEGFAVETFERAGRFLERSAGASYGCVVTDVRMPEMDGLELLRAVRGHPMARKVPFILVTGRGDRELVVKAAAAGVNNYVIKPFTPQTLREKIEQVMGKLS